MRRGAAAKSSIQRGQTALWTVTAWAQGGDVPDATIRLVAAPASLKPTFSFGCGSHDGSTSCDLGALDAKSAQRQLGEDRRGRLPDYRDLGPF